MRRRPAPWASTSGADLAGDAGLRQRLDHDARASRRDRLRLPMLDGAAAADAEMRTERRDALRAGAFDLDQPPAVGMTRHVLDLDGFAAERVGHVDAGAAGRRRRRRRDGRHGR